MPEQQRTEAPTPRRREEARRRGQVFRSVEVTNAVVWITALMVLAWWGHGMMDTVSNLMRAGMAHAGAAGGAAAPLALRTGLALRNALWLLLPLLGALAAASLLSNIAQVGFVFSPQVLAPRWDRINPASGFRRLFSLRSLLEGAKGLLKLALLVWIVGGGLRAELPTLLGLSQVPVARALEIVLVLAGRIALRVALAIGGLALLDFLYQRWEYERNLRMTRQELRDEYRQSEGDPMIRQRLRQRRRQMALQRMMQAVPKATVVVTNPTHVAVALLYHPERMAAPRVLAKGVALVAERIVTLARGNGVPVVPAPAVARHIARFVEVGEEIPPSLYDAVAEIIAYVFDLADERRRAEGAG